VSEVMTSRVVTSNASSTVLDAARLMVEKNIGSVIITKDGRLEGILTERDLLDAVGQGKDVGSMRVSELMTGKVVSVKSNTSVVEAAKKMVLHKFRRLPVVDHGILVGIVTASDLTFDMNSPTINSSVSDYMTRDVCTASLDAPILEALKKMVDRKIGAVVVLDGDAVLGILAERDVVRLVVQRKNLSGLKVKDVFSPELITVEPGTQISHACHLMYYYGIQRFPVVDAEGRLQGIISERDMIEAMFYEGKKD